MVSKRYDAGVYKYKVPSVVIGVLHHQVTRIDSLKVSSSKCSK